LTLSLFPARVPIVNADGTPTAEFVRALNSLQTTINGSVVSAGVEPAVGGVIIPNFLMQSGTSPVSRRWEYPNTNPNGWNMRAGQMTFLGDFYSHNYFTLNPSGHAPIGLRTDIATLAVTPRFAGMIIGSVVGAQEGAPFAPTTQLESRATGLDPGGTLRYLFPNSIGPVTKPLQDATQYRVCLRSTLSGNNQRFLRYQLWRYNTAHSAWDIEVDTGDMIDANIWLDYTKYGLVFASVSETSVTPGAWDITWTNCSVTWAGVRDSITDVSERMNRYDAQVEGRLTFQGTNTRAYVYNDSTLTNFDEWTRFQSSVANSNTSVVLGPNGTSTASNFLATNKSTLTGDFGIATLGMNGARAELTTLGLGAYATPPLDIKVGASVTATFRPAAQDLAGDFTFSGLARRFYLYSNGTTYTDWTQFKSQTANGATSVVASPNGTSTAANFISANKSTLTGDFGFSTFGMNGARAELTTLGIGSYATPPLDIKVGAGTVSTFTTGGQNLAGDFTFTGLARKFYVYSNGTTYTDWTQFKSQTVNGGTSVVSVPNGTSVAANFLATNTPTLTNFSFVSVGMNGADAQINTSGIGSGITPPLRVNIGAVTSATFWTTGLQILNATTTIGLPSSRITGATNVGGTNAVAFGAAAQNFETYCTTGNIKAAVNGATTVGDGVETVLRGLWAEFSCLLADIRDRNLG
jgi:hypothetical protein